MGLAINQIFDFRERAAIFDPTVRLFGMPFPLPTPQGRRDSQFRTMPNREIRMLRDATNTQDMEAISANLFRKKFQDCSETRGQSRPTPLVQSSGAIVTSQAWIQLTGGYARWLWTMPECKI